MNNSSSYLDLNELISHTVHHMKKYIEISKKDMSVGGNKIDLTELLKGTTLFLDRIMVSLVHNGLFTQNKGGHIQFPLELRNMDDYTPKNSSKENYNKLVEKLNSIKFINFRRLSHNNYLREIITNGMFILAISCGDVIIVDIEKAEKYSDLSVIVDNELINLDLMNLFILLISFIDNIIHNRDTYNITIS